MGVRLPQFCLGESRMQFNLVDRRDDAGGVDENGEVLGLEIADSDGPDSALVAQSGESLEGLHVFVERRLRPVDQVEIEIVESKRLMLASNAFSVLS